MLTSCQSPSVVNERKGLMSYFDTCGVGSTWRYEGTISVARRTGAYQHDFNDRRQARISVERVLTGRDTSSISFSCRGWINGQPVNSLLSAQDWPVLDARPEKFNIGPIGPVELSTPMSFAFFEDWPMSAAPATVVRDSNKFYQYQIRLRPVAGTQFIQGKSIPVGTIEAWDVLKQDPTPGLETQHNSTVWVNEQLPGRITRVAQHLGTTVFDISLKSYQIVPRLP